MADKFYSVNLGAQIPTDVTEAASTTSEVVELRVNDAIYGDTTAVIVGVQAILDHLKTVETNPIA